MKITQHYWKLTLRKLRHYIMFIRSNLTSFCDQKCRPLMVIKIMQVYGPLDVDSLFRPSGGDRRWGTCIQFNPMKFYCDHESKELQKKRAREKENGCM